MSITDDLQAHLWAALKPEVALKKFQGSAWWQITKAEMEVFGLELAAVPYLVACWSMYVAIAEVVHNDFHGTDLCKAAAIALPFIKPGHQELEPWVEFARMFNIPARDAYAWYWKAHFWSVRSAAHRYFDEDVTSPWPSSDEDDGLPI